MSGIPAPVTPRVARRRAGAAAALLDSPGAVLAAVAALLGAFLVSATFLWPPHEDEALVLFVGDRSLGSLLHTVLVERGGAPLHFLVAWGIVHAGGRLEPLRLASAAFAVASVPVVHALVRRLADGATALVAVVLASASWVLLFHGVYGRMYSLFLLTSALSYLALVVALERNGARDWVLWGLATLATIATHPYAAIVLATQALYVLGRRGPFRRPVAAFALLAVAATPFWYTDVVLAGRFDVGVGGGGAKLGSPGSVADYLGRVAGDFSAGWLPALLAFVALAGLGIAALARERRPGASFACIVIVLPALVFTLARLGHRTSPESRHLIFALPFFSMLVARGLVAVLRRAGARAGLALAAVAAAGALEVAWAWHETPQLFRGEGAGRVDARRDAADWIASSQRPDDVLFGYEPLYLLAWQRAHAHPAAVVPRADGRLALDELEARRRSLGRGVFVLDAGDSTNIHRRSTIPLLLPRPARRFDARAFGPYLVIRTRGATRTPAGFLDAAARAMRLGDSLGIGDAPLNLEAIREARRLLAQRRTAAASAARSRSTSSS